MSEFTGEIHPFAARFPMLSADDMDALVESIAHVGQTDPILLDTDGRLLDGRNRLEACQRLGIDPVFRTVETDSPESVINSRNALTKPLSTGQRAMAVAMELAAMDLRESGRQKRGSSGIVPNLEVSKVRLSEAGYIIDRDPPLADAVLLGTVPLSRAYEDTKKAQAKDEKETAQLATIAAKASDLYERVVDEDDPTTVEEAYASYEVRYRQEIQDEKDRAERYKTENTAVARAVSTLAGFTSPEHLERFVTEYWPTELCEVNPEPVNPSNLRAIADALVNLATKLEK